MDIPDK